MRDIASPEPYAASRGLLALGLVFLVTACSPDPAADRIEGLLISPARQR